MEIKTSNEMHITLTKLLRKIGKVKGVNYYLAKHSDLIEFNIVPDKSGKVFSN